MEGEAEGYIAFKQPWPGIMRTVYGDQDRFEKTYFQRLVLIRYRALLLLFVLYCQYIICKMK